MRTLKCIVFVLFAFLSLNTYGQFFKNLKKRAEAAAKETILSKTEEKTAEKTSQAMDSIFEAPSKINKSKSKKEEALDESFDEEDESYPEENEETSADIDEYALETSFDFKTGEIPFFIEDYSQDRLGDFPSQWDTNGSGELVSIEGQKWLRLANASMYIPITQKNLPENYTIEFNLLTKGLDRKTSSQAFLTLLFSSDSGFKKGDTWSMVELSPCQFIGGSGVVEKVVAGERQLRNKLNKDIRETIKGFSKVSIAVNGPRIRVWLNENKLVDVPRLMGEGITTFKLLTRGLRDNRNVDELFIQNFKVAITGEDYRSKLLTEGRLSTNTILFASGSSSIISTSNSVIEEVGLALQQHPDLNIKIIGHTDTDGDSAANLQLSFQRANAVKDVLVSTYEISADRIALDGKGATVPIADNTTEEGKKLNRRVEFIKL